MLMLVSMHLEIELNIGLLLMNQEVSPLLDMEVEFMLQVDAQIELDVLKETLLLNHILLPIMF
jgi:hypothetical protein